MRKPPISALRVTKAAVLDDGCPFPLPALPKEIESDANLQRERRWRELQDRYGPQNIQRRQTLPISGGCARCPWDKERLAHEEHRASRRQSSRLGFITITVESRAA